MLSVPLAVVAMTSFNSAQENKLPKEPAPHVAKPATQKPKLPPFPKDEAKWTIRGKVKADAMISKNHPRRRKFTLIQGVRLKEFSMPDGRKILLHTGNGIVSAEANAKVEQNALDFALPNVVVSVSELETRWSSFPAQPPLKVRVDRTQGFDRRAAVVSLGTHIHVLNETKGELTFSMRHGEGTAEAILLPGKTSKLITETGPGKDQMFWQVDDRRAPLGRCWPGDIIALTTAIGTNDFFFFYLGAHHVQAVTDSHGRFSLPKLPNGEYELVAIHELLGKVAKKVKIEGKPRKPVTFVFKVPKELQPKTESFKRKDKKNYPAAHVVLEILRSCLCARPGVMRSTI